jgi:hypothetical protein
MTCKGIYQNKRSVCTWIAYLEDNHESQNHVLDTISLHQSEEDMSPPTTRERVEVLEKLSVCQPQRRCDKHTGKLFFLRFLE